MIIKHIGSTNLVLLNSNTTNLSHDLLHVPKITKNLISVSKFAHNKNVYFEFYSNACYVKHHATIKKMLNTRQSIRFFFKEQFEMAYMFFLHYILSVCLLLIILRYYLC